MQRALDIPEIQALIGEFLDCKSLSICTRVSRSWSETFSAVLYRHVSIMLFSYRSPSIPALKRHNRQIFSLTLTLPVNLEHFSVKCPNLKALYLHGWLGARLKTIAGYKSRGHRKAVALVQRHQQTLRTVSVGLLWPIDKSPKFWAAIAACPRLDTLLVRNEKMFVDKSDPKKQEQKEFWGACARATNLTMKDLDFWSAVNVPAKLDFSQVRELKLLRMEGWHSDKQVMWMGRCSELRVLEWTLPKVQVPTGVGETPVLTCFPASWPKLCELTLDGPRVKDCDLAAVISTAEVLAKLSVPRTLFGSMAFAALRTHHFQVLRHLNLQGCESATSTMVQETMESCPGLEILQAPLLRAVDIILGAPWVCLKLKQLHLETFLMKTDGTDEEVQKVAARFSALKEASLVFPHNLPII